MEDYNQYDTSYKDYNNPENDQLSKDLAEEHEIKRRKRRYWVLIILLFLIGLLGLLGISYLCCLNKKMKQHYETYIQNSRDSFAIVVADLKGQIDHLETEKSRLSGIIASRNKKIKKLELNINDLLVNYNPDKFDALKAKVDDLEAYILQLKADIDKLTAENERLLGENKVLKDQINEWETKYQELSNSYLACCKKPISSVVKPGETPKSEEDRDDYTVVAENVQIQFQALDKKGNLTEDISKVKKAEEVKTFIITFDAKSTKMVDHVFFIRVSDSIKNFLVVPSNYAEVGKKKLNTSAGDEIEYTFSIPHKFDKANEVEKITAQFDPFPKQVRFLPYRVEIYDSKMKHTEGYNRLQSVKGNKKPAKWIW